MSLFGRWLSKFFSSDRRRVPRKPDPGLVAYFWTGGHPAPCRIRDISVDGLFLLTQEHWNPGTLVRLVVQHKDAIEDISATAEGDGVPGGSIPSRSITVQSMVKQHYDDGLGLAFFFLDQHGSAKNGSHLEGATRKEMEKFLQPFL
jgi:hypothetical protein